MDKSIRCKVIPGAEASTFADNNSLIHHMPVVRTLFILYMVIFSGDFSEAQTQMTNEEYIVRFKGIAMQKMREYRIPASITLAQGILESGSGNSNLAQNANNHFGIKCHGWEGRTFYMDDDEENECFRAYNDPEDSYHDHSLFLTQRPRYSSLFELDIMDYKAWAKGLSKAGYATNPRYPELLVRIIDRNELYLYDQLAMGQQLALAEKEPIVQSKMASPDSVSFEIVDYSNINRPIYVNNGKKLIFARNGDSFHTIAQEFSIFGWQIAKYNELNRKDELYEGQMLYLQRKKNKSERHEIHVVQVGETMHAISQLYGIRLKVLQRKNNIPDGVQPVSGSILKLK